MVDLASKTHQNSPWRLCIAPMMDWTVSDANHGLVGGWCALGARACCAAHMYGALVRQNVSRFLLCQKPLRNEIADTLRCCRVP